MEDRGVLGIIISQTFVLTVMYILDVKTSAAETGVSPIHL